MHLPLRLAALLGMPLAGFAAFVGFRDLIRLAWGGPNWLVLAVGLLGWAVLFLLFGLLRWSLARGPQPHPLAAPALDFLALRGLHPAVALGMAASSIGPAAWFLGSGNGWLVREFARRGLEALDSGDVHSALEGLAVACQFGWTAGLAVLFGLHLVQRWKPGKRWLPWVLVPLLVLLAIIGFILLVTLAHFAA